MSSGRAARPARYAASRGFGGGPPAMVSATLAGTNPLAPPQALPRVFDVLAGAPGFSASADRCWGGPRRRAPPPCQGLARSRSRPALERGEQAEPARHRPLAGPVAALDERLAQWSSSLLRRLEVARSPSCSVSASHGQARHARRQGVPAEGAGASGAQAGQPAEPWRRLGLPPRPEESSVAVRVLLCRDV